MIAGLRYDTVRQSARPGGKPDELASSLDAVTGFFGASMRLTDRWTVFANVSRAYRTPGLGELFYSGITGRGVGHDHPVARRWREREGPGEVVRVCRQD